MKTGFFKRFISGSLATLMIVAAMMTGAQAKVFDDVTTDEHFAEQIEILTDIGIIKGTGETEFSPDDSVSREQMALFLFRLMIGKDNAGSLNTTKFTDLYDDTYSGAISWANASGYIIGTSDTTFSPDMELTRAQAVTFLWAAAGKPEPTGENSFADVKESDWFYKAVLWAVEKGITAGTSATTFGPNEACTRAQVVTFLWAAEGNPASTAAVTFTDVYPTDYYYTAVAWALENEVTDGIGGNRFGSTDTCTRAEMVTFLYRTLA